MHKKSRYNVHEDRESEVLMIFYRVLCILLSKKRHSNEMDVSDMSDAEANLFNSPSHPLWSQSLVTVLMYN